MHLSKQQIEEFRVLYVKQFGKIIPEEEAREMATNLINLYLAIYRPLPDERSDQATPPLEEHRDDHRASFPNPE